MTRNQRRRWRYIQLLALLMCAMWGLAVARVLPARSAGIVVAVAGLVLLVPVRGRRTLMDWFVVAFVFIFRFRRSAGSRLASINSSVVSETVGVRWEGQTLVAVLEVAPTLAMTAANGRDVTADNVLPVQLVAQCMRQYGLDLAIDIISAGQRVSSGSDYRTQYSEIIGKSPLVGQRRTWLILRLNVIESLAGIVARGPSRTSAPRALEAAAQRVAQRLREQGIRAHALSAKQLETMTEVLLEPTPLDQVRERWSAMRADNVYATTCVADPAKLSDVQLDRCWAWHSESTLVAIKLIKPDDPRVGVLVRYVAPARIRRRRVRAEPGALFWTTGTQRRVFTATLPCGDRSFPADIITVRLADLDVVNVPIGPAGQIIGHVDGAAVAIPLCDHSEYPKRLRIDARVQLALAHQMALRAVATGTVVSVHADNRARWEGLIAAVNNPDLLFLATAGAKRSGIAVFDGKSVSAVAARTVMVLSPPRDGPPDDGVDLTFVQKQASVMEVIVGDDEPVMVAIGRSPEESRYLNLGRKNTTTRPAGQLQQAPDEDESTVERQPRRRWLASVAAAIGRALRFGSRRRAPDALPAEKKSRWRRRRLARNTQYQPRHGRR